MRKRGNFNMIKIKVSFVAVLLIMNIYGIYPIQAEQIRPVSVKALVEPKYSQASKAFSDGMAAVMDFNIKKWGYINESDELTVPFKYDGTEPFMEEFHVSKVYINQYYKEYFGLVNMEGKEIVACRYSDIQVFKNNIVLAQSDNGFDMYRISGELIKSFEKITYITWQCGEYYHDTGITVKNISETGPWFFGFIDFKGDFIFKPVYDYIGVTDNNRYIVSYKNSYGVFDKNLKLMVPFEYESIVDIGENYLICRTYEGDTELMDENCNKIKWPEESFIDPFARFENGYFKAQADVHASPYPDVGLLDKDGKIIVEQKYAAITFDDADKNIVYLYPELFGIQKVEIGVINDSGLQKIIPKELPDIPFKLAGGGFNGHNFVCIETYEGDYGVIDKSGNSVVSFTKDYELRRAGQLIIKQEILGKDENQKNIYGRCALLNNNGQLLTEYKYDEIYSIENQGSGSHSNAEACKGDRIVVSKDGKENILDLDGYKEKFEWIYKNISVYGDYIVARNMNDKYGILDMSGNIIVDFVYDEITGEKNSNVYSVCINGYYGFIKILY